MNSIFYSGIILIIKFNIRQKINNICNRTFKALVITQAGYLLSSQKDSKTPFKWVPPTPSSPPSLPPVKPFSSLTTIPPFSYLITHSEASTSQEASEALRLIELSCDNFKLLSPSMKDNKQVVLAAVTQDGLLLGLVSTALRNNREIALAAVLQDADAYDYVGDTLRNNPEILRIVRGTGKLSPFDIDTISQRIDELAQNENSTIGLFASEQLLKDGIVDSKKIQNFLTVLRKKAKEGIYFTEPESSSLSGGTCSAMSLTFIHELLSNKKPITNITEFKSALRELSSKATTKDCITKSCPSLRDLQMSFNSIRIAPQDRPKNLDFSKHKIESLAKIYGFSIKTTSQSIAIRDDQAKTIFKEEMEKLPKGIYLLRALNKADNEKLESFGHSLLFIKAEDFIGLYDPSVGMKIASPKRLDDFIQNTVLFSLKRYALHEARFYEIEQSTS
ncbi:MAG: DUF4116 domain-containing protein [Chlamydiota bacterium]